MHKPAKKLHTPFELRQKFKIHSFKRDAEKFTNPLLSLRKLKTKLKQCINYKKPSFSVK